MKCRNCSNVLEHVLVDLGTAPPSNSFLSKEDLNKEEIYYPLKVMICEKCFLVQLDEFKKSSEIFGEDYVYFSSYSNSVLEHSKRYTDMITKRLELNKSSFVVEVASNDGYLLKNFLKAEIPCLGVEPTLGTANVARKLGIETMTDFFGVETAKKIVSTKGQADLAIGNNVLAHVPNIHDFVGGFKILLKKDGVVTFEFPHLKELIEKKLFDTIYHEHFSYLSLIAVSDIFTKNGLKVFDVEILPTQGGSLRVYGTHIDSSREVTSNVRDLLILEEKSGLKNMGSYSKYQSIIETIKFNILSFLLDCKSKGKTVVGYGAAAKGNTVLNYCGVSNDLISYVCDASPYKQGTFLPGSRIPVFSPEKIKETKPDFVIIFPWNIKEEVIQQMSNSLQTDSRFVTFIPELAFHEKKM